MTYETHMIEKYAILIFLHVFSTYILSAFSYNVSSFCILSNLTLEPESAILSLKLSVSRLVLPWVVPLYLLLRAGSLEFFIFAKLLMELLLLGIISTNNQFSQKQVTHSASVVISEVVIQISLTWAPRKNPSFGWDISI